jgi:hypothetical protein
VPPLASGAIFSILALPTQPLTSKPVVVVCQNAISSATTRPHDSPNVHTHVSSLRTTNDVQKPASAAKKKKASPKKKKSTASATKKAKTETKKAPKYDMPGQKKETPHVLAGMRLFYESLHLQNPDSLLALRWCMVHGCLERDAAEKAVKLLGVAKKTTTTKKATAKKKTTTKKKAPAKKKAKKMVKPTIDSDSDSDDDAPLV